MMVHTNPILYILLSYQVQTVCTHDYAFGVHTVGKNVPMANDFTSRFIASMDLSTLSSCPMESSPVILPAVHRLRARRSMCFFLLRAGRPLVEVGS